MAGSLIMVDEFTISSPVASVILGGGSSGSSGLNASIDSTYDVYMVAFNNVQVEDSASSYQYFYGRVTESGTPNTTSNYDYAGKLLDAHYAFSNISAQNQDKFQPILFRIADDSTGFANGIIYIYNANNSSEYTFLSLETTSTDASGEFASGQGGAVFTSSSQVDGLNFYFGSSKNITAGKFTLFGLKK